ncbi:MAG: hypothetical protein KAV87_30190 [Desulfobacteraceae bacterium]|nr:hypothetical protein [Desulfobacteraceae bacterium]
MKVCILTEAGKNIGFGHVTRCTSIYQAFEEVGIEPQLIVNGDDSVEDLVRTENCRIFDWVNDYRTLVGMLSNTDIAFIDSYLANYRSYEAISGLADICIYLDDDMRIEYPKGFVLNGAVFAEEMPYPKRKEVNYLLGAKYAPLRKEFWEVPAKPIRNNLEAIMITCGGADIHNLTPKVLKVVVDTYPQLLVKVIVGRGFQNTREIEAPKDNNTELIYCPDAAEMKKVMLESDIAISAGGQTLYELARIGVPTIGICVAENQLRNIHGWEKTGFLEYVGWYSDDNIEERLEDSLKYLAHANTREEKSEIGRRIVDGQGPKRVVCKIITNWRNLQKKWEKV